MFFSKKVKEYDKENLRPVIMCSICTGEQTAGFKNIHNGKFTGVMLITSPKDLDTFAKMYGISKDEIPKDY